MMGLKLLVQGLQVVGMFHQLADKCNLHKQVNDIQIEIYSMHLICFSNMYELLSLLFVFIENQSHCLG